MRNNASKSYMGVVAVVIAVFITSTIILSTRPWEKGGENGSGIWGENPPDDNDGSLSEEAYNAWMGYRESGSGMPTVNTSALVLGQGNTSLEVVEELAGEESFVTSEMGGYYAYGYNGSVEGGAGGAPAPVSEEKAQVDNAREEREVEEADIVKVKDDVMYVLNPYRGLIMVDISQPTQAEVISRVALWGYPVEMYVVDYLAIIILKTNYNYWYNAFLYEDALNETPEFYIGTKLVVVNVYDPSAPFIAKTFDIQGFASNSRRVGDVIYLATNTYSWYWYRGYMDNVDATFITSVDLSDPKSVGVVDCVSFPGTSNQIHATPNAIFVAQPTYNYGWWRQDGGYYTNVTYVDISDPHGKIFIRGHFTADGYLEDKYQMDYYDGMFRMVTHFYSSTGESKLWIYDVSDPDNITLMGSLLIDDAGNLMATRFAGPRAYTIHLPHSVDPLDAIDLSDPYNPRLADVLEMPGWVTHMEVMGTRIIALGVDDSGDSRNVAVSLFDVSDVNHTKMLDRVRIGGDYAWSEANWDPKALSIVDSINIVIVPFNSYERETYRSTYGFQIVKYDLDMGRLWAKGSVYGIDSITRTRYHNGYVLATSDSTLQVVDASNLDKPRIVRTIELSANVVDSVLTGDLNVQLIRNWQEDVLRLRLRDKEHYDTGQVIDEAAIPADYGSIIVDGDMVCVLGYRYQRSWYSEWRGHESFVYVFDIGNGNLREAGHISISDGYISKGYYLGDGYVVVSPNEWYYYYRGDGMDMKVLHCSMEDGPKVVADFTLPDEYVYSPLVSGGIMYYTTHSTEYGCISLYDEKTGWTNVSIRNTTYYLGRVDLRDPKHPKVMDNINVPGPVVGASEDGKYVYTTSEWTVNYTYTYSTLDILLMDETTSKARIVSSVKLPARYCTVRVEGTRAYILRTGYYYPYYWSYDSYMLEGGEVVNAGERRGGYYPGLKHEVNSTLMVIDLSNPQRPTIASSLELYGSYGFSFVEDGTVGLWSWGNNVLMVLQEDGNGMEAVGAYNLMTSPTAAHVSDGMVDVVLGRYGVVRISLTSP